MTLDEAEKVSFVGFVFVELVAQLWRGRMDREHLEVSGQVDIGFQYAYCAPPRGYEYKVII